MGSGQRGALLRDVRRLFDEGSVAGLSERELLARFVAGRDEAAFAALLSRHGPIVLGVCRRWLREPRDVEDAFQATVLILIRKAGSIKEPNLLGAWLHGVAHRVAHRASRAVARRSDRERSGLLLEAVEGRTRPDAENEDLRVALDQEIHRLPDVLRLPIVLCHLEGMTQAEAASRLRTTPDGVRGRLARGRAKLRARLARRGFPLPVGLLILDLAAEAAPAAMPAALVEQSLDLARPGAVPTASSAILAKGVIRAMTLDHLKTIATAVLGVGILAAAATGFAARTTGDGGKATASPPKAVEEPREVATVPKAQPRSIRVEARDFLTDAPIPGVQIKFDLSRGPGLEAKTEVSGSATFDLPVDDEIRYFKVSASRAGFVPLANRWSRASSTPAPPDHFLFRMEKATTVGGRLLDQAGQPIADATVVVEVTKRYPKTDQWVDIRYETTKTDAGGRWSFADVPAEPDAISLAAYHLLHLSADTSFYPQEFKSLAALRDGTAILGIEPRGTLIEGQVLSPEGRPIGGAEVFHGEGRRFGNSIPPARTDAEGRFTLGFRPGTISTLTAQAAGFAPVGQELRVEAEPKRVVLKLRAAKVLGGRVVDRAGKPVPGATVMVGWSPTGPASTGRGSEAIAVDLTADADGRFAWNEAPEGGASAEAWAPGYLSRNDIALAPGAENQVVLTAETKVKGAVVDAETGQPVPRFTLTLASVRKPGERLLWQRGVGMDQDAKKAPGSFEYTLSYTAHQFLVRVEGEGYLPEDSELFSPDGTTREFTFRLTRASPIRGTVSNPDGTPARDAIVSLVPANEQVQLVNGRLSGSDRDATIRSEVAPDGRFSLSPRRDDYVLFALSDAGIAVARRRELRGDDALRLQPWARVTGTVEPGLEPGGGIDLSQSPEDEARPKSLDEPRFYQQYTAKVDQAGRFEFPRVAPGRHTFGHWVPNGVARRSWFVNLATVDAEPGRSYDLKIGGSGRAVSGRLALPSGDVWMIRKASIEPEGDEGRAAPRGVRVFGDGRFRAEDLAAGKYSLRIDVHEPPAGDECGWGRLISRFSRSFTVSGGAGAAPIDLGTLAPVEVGGKPLEVGEHAPAFAAKTPDGRDFRLADYRGKFVLLDFWATWCAPCLAEVPNLKAIHDAFGADRRFEVVSLSLDEDPADARLVADSLHLPWRQGYLGPDSPVADAYGATAIPATFLIGPDGKILAMDLRGPRMKAAVEAVLKP